MDDALCLSDVMMVFIIVKAIDFSAHLLQARTMLKVQRSENAWKRCVAESCDR